MSSQCKGTTKSGSPCKIAIVLPNGYCRVHQEQYVVEKKENTKEVESDSLKVEEETIKEIISDEKRESSNTKYTNSTTYVRNLSSSKRWYVVPVFVMAFFWVLTQFLKKKKNVNH